MGVHANVGDCIVGKRLVYEASKAPRPSLIRKSGKHRGVRGKLYNAKCWIEKPIQMT